MAHAPIGFRIRTERKSLGMTQAALAKKAGISASYLNLIEANKRPIGGALVGRIAALLGVDADALTGRAERRLIADLMEAAADPLLRRFRLTPTDAGDLVGRHGEWAHALLALHRALRDQTAIADALSDRLNQDPFLGDAVHQLLTHVTAIRSSSEILDDMPDMAPERRDRFHSIISKESERLSDAAQALAGFFDKARAETHAVTPADEVDDFLIEHVNHFPDLEATASRLRESMNHYGGTDEGSLRDFLRVKHGFAFDSVSPAAADTAHFRNQIAADPDIGRVLFLSNAATSTRRFQLAKLIAEIEAPDEIATLLDDPRLVSDEARDRARHVLASYVAGAVIFPYDDFLRAATDCRFDIEILRQQFGSSHEQVCHRLVTLRAPEREGVPFAFLRSDPAGHVTKRFPLPRLPLPRYGHACPLWAVFAAFQTPDRVVRQLAEFPDGARYLMVARSITKRPALFHERPFLHSVMLVCDVLQADRTVYADGLDLSATRTVTPVGPSCRMCTRDDCRFRGEPAMVERLTAAG